MGNCSSEEEIISNNPDNASDYLRNVENVRRTILLMKRYILRNYNEPVQVPEGSIDRLQAEASAIGGISIEIEETAGVDSTLNRMASIYAMKESDPDSLLFYGDSETSDDVDQLAVHMAKYGVDNAVATATIAWIRQVFATYADRRVHVIYFVFSDDEYGDEHDYLLTVDVCRVHRKRGSLKFNNRCLR